MSSLPPGSARPRDCAATPAIALFVYCLASPGLAQSGGQVAPKASIAEANKAEEEKESPWLIVPTFSANPKLGASVGAMVAYLHYFDEESRSSTFGIAGQYTSTDSTIASVFGRASWGQDHHRAIAMLAAGNIRNDYDDYLGTGVPLKTNDDLHAFVTRYLYRVKGDWFAGVQGAYANYQLLGDSPWDDQVLDVLGLEGFKSGGAGISIYHDSRDSDYSPHEGVLVNVNNMAYRDWIAGSSNYDVYRADFRAYFGHGENNVLAVRQYNQFTHDAPISAFAPVQLRGYTPGEYLGQYMSSLEVEERLGLGERWTASGFAGAAVLYGDSPTNANYNDVFPSVGAGLQYVLKKKEGIVLNLEGALGRDNNYGVYVKMGYGF